MSFCTAAAALLVSAALLHAQTPATIPLSETQALQRAGRNLFGQDCAFCHGKDAGGGETGPDLTGSALVAADVNGNKIGPVIRQGRPDKGMPAFHLSDPDIAALVAFIHYQQHQSELHPGARRRVDVSDLQSGDAEAGKRYFNGAGGCAACHSASGDLAGVARRYIGLKLEQQLLYPSGAKAKVTVTLPSGQALTGTLNYRDEFAIGMVDENGWYHSWPAGAVKYKIDDPVQAHAELLGKYTDDDIHNLMAYLQTLK